MDKKINWKTFIPAQAIPLATGGLAGALTRQGMKTFEGLNKPPLSPPGWLFPVVWTALYVAMGTASYLVYEADASQPRKERALTVYGIQLALNFLWPIVFFTMGQYLPAFIILILLWLCILLCILLFSHISKTAAWLMLPYLLWVSFAGYLNLGVYLLN